jgi:lipopolysaccharide/colanic/teichoic acid biosynthesis glycosyltransferase
VAKRLFDIVLALLALLLFSPVMLAAALAVWLDSGRPVLFAQTRVGRGALPFHLYKFRSMVVNAAQRGSAHAPTLGHDPRCPPRGPTTPGGGPAAWYSTAQNDPRITRVGRFLRRSSVDELPQLLNVLRGDMSLVGPRPDVPAQRSNYTEDEWALRHRVRPGITGLAQALYRSSATPQQRLQADLDYAQHHGLLVDLRIIGLTVVQLFRRNAN